MILLLISSPEKSTESALRPSKRLRGIHQAPASDSAAPAVEGTVKTQAKSRNAAIQAAILPAKARQVMSHVEVRHVDDVYRKTRSTSPHPPPPASPIPSSSKSSPFASDEEMDEPPRPKRRASTKRVDYGIGDSDDEDIKPPKKKGRLSKAGASVSRSGSEDFKLESDDDYEHDDKDEDVEGVEDVDIDDEDPEEDTKKSKSSARAKSTLATAGKAKSKSKSKASGRSEEEAMDVDDASGLSDEGSSQAAKKRKRADSEKKPKKPKVLRETVDPWKLRGAATRRDWTEMKAPPLEMFHFSRVVVDEYTYLGGKTLSMISRLSSDRHWVLSGTPPVHDFAAVKTIAKFLDVHLGVDDDGEGTSAAVKKRIREQTGKHSCYVFLHLG